MLNLYQLRDHLKIYKNRKLAGVCKVLKEKTHLTSNQLSLIGFVLGIIAIYFLFQNHKFFVLFIILATLLDILDGAFAKLEGKKDEGWIVDAIVDRSLIVILFVKTALYFSFPYLWILMLLFIFANFFIMYQRLILKRNIEMMHGYHFLYVFYIFGLYKYGLIFLFISYLIHFTILLFRFTKSKF